MGTCSFGAGKVTLILSRILLGGLDNDSTAPECGHEGRGQGLLTQDISERFTIGPFSQEGKVVRTFSGEFFGQLMTSGDGMRAE